MVFSRFLGKKEILFLSGTMGSGSLSWFAQLHCRMVLVDLFVFFTHDGWSSPSFIKLLIARWVRQNPMEFP
jgi:hypothetical protein